MSEGAALGAVTPGSGRWWARPAASELAGSAATSADKRLYVEGGLVPVRCQTCSTHVLVKKNSRAHTSIQWITDAAASCPQIGAQVAAGASAAQVLGCPDLAEAIAQAVAAGTVTVPDD